MSKLLTLEKRGSDTDGEYYYLHFTEDAGTQRLRNVVGRYTG